MLEFVSVLYSVDEFQAVCLVRDTMGNSFVMKLSDEARIANLDEISQRNRQKRVRPQPLPVLACLPTPCISDSCSCLLAAGTFSS